MKQLFRQFVLSLFILGLVLPVWAQSYPFKDVGNNSAYKEVYLLNKYNFLDGINYEIFGGELNFNRFHLADTLDAMLGNQEVSATNIFILNDVSPNSPRYKKISRVLQAGLIELDTSTFEGLRPITRYELAYSLYQLLRFKSAPVPPPRETNIKFRDVSPKYKDAVEQIANIWQITEGYPNGQFKGDNRLTRYEAALMFDKVAAILYTDYQDTKANGVIPKPPIILKGVENGSNTDNTGPAIVAPSNNQSLVDLLKGSPSPVIKPSQAPSAPPSTKPSVTPSPAPTLKPTAAPSAKPTLQPTAKPSATASSSKLEELLNGTKPSVKPSVLPSARPTLAPASTPTPRPSASIDVSKIPDIDITGSATPSVKPSAIPTLQPPVKPSAKPSVKPSVNPSAKPTVKPPVKPSAKPTAKPPVKPSAKPSVKPPVNPSAKPTAKPTAQPSAKPSAQSSQQPAAIQSAQPTPRPSALGDLEQRLNELRESSKPAITTPSAKPEQPDSLVDIPLPSARPTIAPDPKSTPKPIESNLLPNVGLKKKPPLRSRILLLGNWRMLYEERVPDNIMTALSMPASSQTISGDAGISAHLNSMFWFGEPNTPLGNLGVVVDLSTLGGFQFNGADLTDLVWADAGVMYKLFSSENFDFAAGLEGYYRMTESSDDPRNNYFQASRNYIGVGPRLTTAYRLWDPLTIELTLAPHYVIQDLSNIALPAELPLNRFDTQIQFLINWELFDIGSSKLSLDLGYQGLFLFDLGSEASQMMHGVLFGAGYHF